MIQEIINALTTKFPGVDAKIISRYAAKIAKTVTTSEEVTTAVEGVTIQNIIESYGDSRATDASQTAVSNYEKKHGLKEGKKVEGGGPKEENEPTPKGDDTPAWAKKLISDNEELRRELTTLKGGRIEDTRKKQLDGILNRSKREDYKSRITKDFGRITFKDDEDFNAWLEEVKTDVDSQEKETKVKGVVFKTPGSTRESQEPTEKPSKEELDSVMNNLKV